MLNRVLCAIVLSVGLLTSIGQVQAGSWCDKTPNPTIKIIPQMANIRYDYSKSFTDLSKVKIGHNPYGSDAIAHTFGLANGQFRIEHTAKFQILTNPNVNQTCMWYDNVDVNIKMSPVIMIAKEYRKGGCHYNEVMAHELEHIAVDKQVTNEYAQKLGQKIRQILLQKSLFGPFPNSQKASIQKQMQDRLNDAVKINNDQMMAERARRQAQIDSRENYDAISKKLHDVCDKKSPITAKRVQRKL